MLLSENNLTIVIVTFKSERVIEKCSNSIDQKYAIIGKKYWYRAKIK